MNEASISTKVGTDVLAMRNGGLWPGTVVSKERAGYRENASNANTHVAARLTVEFKDGQTSTYSGQGIADYVLVAS